jgi:putative aldouronate transport system permease protein
VWEKIVKPNNNLNNRHQMTAIRRFGLSLSRYRYLHLMVLPGIIVVLLFKYLPMIGLVVAFKSYTGAGGGFWGIWEAPSVGLTNFVSFFQSQIFGRIIANTLIISSYRIIFFFPVPIVLALMINELRSTLFKKTVQTITYMPFFFSWVVVAGLISFLLSPTDGPVNQILMGLGFKQIHFLGSTRYFRSVLVLSDIWKNAGYASIIYLAAIANIDQEQMESARIDGANKFQRIIYITLPSIAEIIAIMLILSVGRALDDNFEQIYNLYSPAVYSVSDVLETYIFRTGILGGKFSYTAAVGLFKSALALLLVLSTNRVAKKLGSQGLV